MNFTLLKGYKKSHGEFWREWIPDASNELCWALDMVTYHLELNRQMGRISEHTNLYAPILVRILRNRTGYQLTPLMIQIFDRIDHFLSNQEYPFITEYVSNQPSWMTIDVEAESCAYIASLIHMEIFGEEIVIN